MAIAAVTAAADAAEAARAAPLKPRTKGVAADVVTEADRAAEAAAVAVLRRHRPGDGILGEEGTDMATGRRRRWVIDGVDGTVGFARGLTGAWCSAVALEDENGPKAAAVYDPQARELHAADRGAGATVARLAAPPDIGPLGAAPPDVGPLGAEPLDVGSLGAAPAEAAAPPGAVVPPGAVAPGAAAPGPAPARTSRVRAPRPLAEAYVAVFLRQDRLVLPGVRTRAHALLDAAGLIRHAGPGSLELAWVADGRLDAWIQPVVDPWDWVPGALLVTEAHGDARTTHADGTRWHLAGPAALLDEIEERLALR